MNTHACISEAEVLTAIEEVVRRLAPSFRLPGMAADDIGQEIRLFALQGLPRYDPRPDASGTPTRPLPNFLYAHVRNRLLNLRRDCYRRSDAPCRECHDGRPCGPEGQVCDKYRRWAHLQAAKLAVRQPLPLALLPEDGDHHASKGDVADEVAVQELLRKLDEHLDPDLRATYLQMRAGVTPPKQKRQAVETAVRELLQDEEEE